MQVKCKFFDICNSAPKRSERRGKQRRKPDLKPFSSADDDRLRVNIDLFVKSSINETY